MMDISNSTFKRKQIYKEAKQMSILHHTKRNQNNILNRSITMKSNSLSKIRHTHFRPTNSQISPPHKIINLKPIKEFQEKIEPNPLDYSYKETNKFQSPYSNSNLNNEFFWKYYSPKISSKESMESPIIQNEKKDNNNKQREHELKVKMMFYFLISLLYYSLYLLCMKILFNFSMPQIPPLGTSLFIISFNNVVLSIIFIIMDQIDYLDYLHFKKIIDNFPKMIINFISILLIIKSLEKLNLITFIILINMKPIIISYFKIRDSNKIYQSIDTFCYFLLCLIILFELYTENKASIICTYILITLLIIGYFSKLNRIKSLHPYFSIFGSSLIGISISPIIMVLNKDILIISFSQYLLFLIISLTYFLHIYFLNKYTQYSFGKKFKIFGLTLNYLLFLIYSNLILRENNANYTYIFFLSSFFINNYAFLRNDSINL